MNNCRSVINRYLAAGLSLLALAAGLAACGASVTTTSQIAAVGTREVAVVPASASPSPTTLTAAASQVPTATPVPTRPATSTPTQSPSPTHTPGPTATPTPLPLTATPTRADTRPANAPAALEKPVQVSETVITLPTYPIQDYLVEQTDPLYNIPVFYFNRPAFEEAAPTPSPVDYQGVVLENNYLRLTFLPELGGRLYSAVVKATGQEIFYHNPVVKPSRYGGLQPTEANWWLAAGGMEWAYPTQEHGYRWGVPWSYKVKQSAHGATITLSDLAPDRVGAEVEVTLAEDSAVFTVTPRLVNNTARAAPVQFWLNAALTLGSASMSPDTRFVIPTDKVVIHSRGVEGWLLPEAQLPAAWPRMGLINLSDYSQWANYLGFFVPYLPAPFMGAYNPDTDLGVARLIEPGQVPGSKLFAFGSSFGDRSYTDNDSQYFEIWGGANTGFWPQADVTVPPGGTLQWQESWWPLPQLGGLTWANRHAAIYVSRAGDDITLSLLVPQPSQGRLLVLDSQQTILFTAPYSAQPAAPQQWHFAASAMPARVQIVDNANHVLLDYHLNQDDGAHD